MQLENEIIQEIRRLYAAGNDVKTLAEWSGLKWYTIAEIVRGL